ncbi:DUF262 domain-containing protein [Arcanobacterium phocae]|nr:DUF262 domain-containing protein [Arcanobacterium phocae]
MSIYEISDEESYELSEEEREDTSISAGNDVEVSYSGQDFDVEGLVRRLNKDDILIPRFGNRNDDIETGGFQRGFVWNKSQQDKFIESILLGYPIPNIFLVKQEDQRLLVLDGQQRLVTLQQFYNGFTLGDRKFTLESVDERFKGRDYRSLPDDLRRQLDNALIQAIVLSTRPDPMNHRAIYQIFERLNSGGTQLTSHEVRIASYAGDLVDYIEDLNSNSCWRKLYGKRSPRVRDHELVTRILAMYLGWQGYKRPQKLFLNNFMESGLTPNIKNAGTQFLRAAEILSSSSSSDVALKFLSNQVNNAWSDALFVGLMTRLSESGIEIDEVENCVRNLRKNQDFSAVITGSTADERQVMDRMNIAISAFRNVD